MPGIAEIMASRGYAAIGVRTLSLRIFRETRRGTLASKLQLNLSGPGQVCPAPDVAR